jgi:2-dehydro-3-deoxygluconokinase
MELDVVTFGEAMAMFIAMEEGELESVSRFAKGLAGAEANVAVGLARLGFKVGWVSKVGNDPLGKYIRMALEREGVDIRQVITDETRPTGLQLKSKVSEGDPQVHYFRKGSAASSMDVADFPEDYFFGARHLHMTGIPPALSASMRHYAERAMDGMKAQGKTISFDPNLRPVLWKSVDEMVSVINQFAFHADWVLPGLTEGRILTGYTKPQDIAAFYLDRGVSLVAVKLGPKGAYYRTADGQEGWAAGFPVDRVVDTVGAGDGFAVGVISGKLEHLPIAEAVKRGNAIGAMAVMSPGDMDGLPSREELDEFLARNEARSL